MKKIALLLALLLSPLGALAQTTDLYRVATIAVLKGLNPQRPPVAIVMDTATAGEFKWGTSACTAADDVYQITPTAGPTGCWTRLANTTAIGLAPDISRALVTSTGSITARTLAARFAQTISLQDYYQVSDGANYGPALVRAEAALAVTGGTIEIPATGPSACLPLTGTHTTITSAITYQGQGRLVSCFTSNFNGNVFVIGDGTTTVRDVTISGVSFTSSTVRSTGASVAVLNGYNTSLVNVTCEANQYICVDLYGGPTQYVYNLTGVQGFSGQAGVRIGVTGANVQYPVLTRVQMSNMIGEGIDIFGAGGALITDSEALGNGIGLRIRPGSGQTVEALLTNNVFLDANTTNGLVVAPTGTGIVAMNVHESLWAGTNGSASGGSGILINGTAANILGLQFKGLQAVNNGGHGVEVLGGTQLQFDGMSSANSATTANTYSGYKIAANVSNFQIKGVAGLGTKFSNLQKYGVEIAAGTTDHFKLEGNFNGNVTSSISNGASGTNFTINNDGVFTTTSLVSPSIPFRTPETQDPTAGSGSDDTATFAAIFAAGYNIKTTKGKTYRLNGLSMNGNTIDCGGGGGIGTGGASSIITGNATSPAGPAIIMKGWGSQLLGCGLGDPNDYSLISTTLASPALALATSVVVTSAANLSVGRLLFITLDSGVVWPVKIATIVGTTITFTSGDALPTAAAATNVVRTASGVVRIDAAPSAGATPNATIFNQIRDSVFNAQPMAIELVNTDANPVGNSAFNKQGTISNVATFYTKLLPLWMSNDVESYQFSDLDLYGYFPNESSACVVQDGRGSVVAYGGHRFLNINCVQHKNDFILKAANLSLYSTIVSDSPNGILVSQASQWLQFNNVFTSAQNGTSGTASPLGGYGVKVTGTSVQISLSNLQQYSGGSATNLWIDSGSTVRLDTLTWGGNRTTGGTGAYISDLGVSIGTSLALGGATIGSNALAVTGHVLLEGVTSTGATGTGPLVFGTSPALTTPDIGAATATTLAIGGASLSGHALAVTGAVNVSTSIAAGTLIVAPLGGASCAAPTFTFATDLDSGLARSGNGIVRLCSNTATSMETSGSSVVVSPTQAVPAGGTAGLGMMMSTSLLGVTFGSGVPTASWARGSLYLRSDGTPYYNTNGSTGWEQLASTVSPTFTGTVTTAALSATTGSFSGALTYGGVTLSNAVTGTGNMVLSASPTMTGTLTVPNITAPASMVVSVASANALTINDGATAKITYFNSALYSSTDAGTSLGVAGQTWNGVYATLANTATTSAVCYNTSTKLFTYNGTVGTCTVSALRYKVPGKDITSDVALTGMSSLRTQSWTYKKVDGLDARERVGLYADDVAKMDPRCATYNDKKEVENYDDRCILAYAVAAIKTLKVANDNLKTEINALKKAAK